MIKIIQYCDSEQMKRVYSRSQLDLADVNATVQEVLCAVKDRGDAALYEYAKKFDNCDVSTVRVAEEEFAAAYEQITPQLLQTIRRAKENILNYHLKQLPKDYEEKKDGASIGWKFLPVNSAGIYVPGGTAAYPSSVLMTALPAVAAGVKNIYMTTPFKNGKINPVTLVAAAECGVSEVYKVGGAQAIAALCYGTETVKKVHVIAGPGNIYVTVAKKMVYGHVGIDMIAGPSEILIIADESANPIYLAADMLSQAEHDTLASSFLITNSKKLAEQVKEQIKLQVEKLDRADIAKQALEKNSAIVVCENLEQAIEVSNTIAPEHLELCCNNPREVLQSIQSAGAVFLGNYSPEPLGDYYAGPNHVLPTSGSAKFFSVLNTLTFLKRISIIEYNKKSLKAVADDVIALANCEGLQAHANAIAVRKD